MQPTVFEPFPFEPFPIEPFLFEPFLPFVCLAAAALAPLVALLLHRRAPRRAAPLSGLQVTLHGLLGLAGLVACLIFGLVLERCVAAALLRTGQGVGLADPMTWLGMVVMLLGGAARLAWQALLLGGPLVYALRVIAGRRLPAGLARLVGAACLAPLVVAAIVAVIPLTRPDTTLLALILIVFAAVLTAAWPRARPVGPAAPPVTPVVSVPLPAPTVLSAPIAVHALAEPLEEHDTRVTRLPAALAASLKTLQAATRPMPPPSEAACRLSEAAVRRARRSRRTL